MVTIRLLTTADVEAYRTIRLSALKTNPEAFSSAHEDQVQFPFSRFTQRLEESQIFGAFTSDAQLVGIVVLHVESGPKVQHKGWILSFFVEPAARGMGAGTKLLQAAEEAAQGKVEQLLLGVSVGNRAAQSVYEKRGFVVYGVEPRAMKLNGEYIDEALMVKMLGI